MKRLRLFTAILLASCCLSALPVFAAPSDNVSVAMPAVHIGDFWKYRVVDEFSHETTNEFSQRVVEISEKEIVVQLQNKNSDRRVQRFFTREWNALDIGDTAFKPYYPEYKFPLAVGMEWQQQFQSTRTSGQFFTSFVRARVSALEQVTVPAGAFDAYKIERDIESRSADASSTLTTSHIITWYAPSVNRFVRREIVTTANGRVRGKTFEELIEFVPQPQ